MPLESGHAVSRAGCGPHKHGNKAQANEPHWAGTSQSLHEWHGPLQRERKGRAVLAQLPFTRGRWRYSVTLSTGTDHRPFEGLSPESSSVRENFLCPWCHLGLSGKLRPLNFQGDPFLPVKCPWTQSTRGRAMIQLQNSWSSTAGSKAQHCDPTVHSPS